MPTHAMPAVVDRATWRATRDELLAREKAHTHEGDAIAAARRNLPMTSMPPVTVAARTARSRCTTSSPDGGC